MGKKFGVIIDDDLAKSVVEIATLNKVSPSRVVGLIVENQLSYFRKIGRYPIFKNSVIFEFPEIIRDENYEENVRIARTPWLGLIGNDDDEEE